MKKIYNLGVFILLPFLGFSQAPLLNFDFDGGLQDWVVNSIECNGEASDEAKWIWVADGSTEQGIYSSGYGQLDSRTPDNGIVILNSEFLDNKGLDNNQGNGDCPAPQIAELISPKLDFSAESEVYMSFSQMYNRFIGYRTPALNEASETATFVAVSTDGNSWEEIPVNEDVTTFRTNDLSVNELTLNLTSYLAGKSDVQVKFLWRGDYYFWGVDDVRFYGSYEDDVAILGYKYIAPNFETPKAMIQNDTLRFVADVVNLGSNVIDSAYLRVFFRSNNSARTEYFRDSMLLVDLMPNDTMEVHLENYFIPGDLPIGAYVFFYNIANTKDVEEINNSNNFAAEIVVLSEGTYRKTDRGDGSGFVFENSVIIGNYYETNFSDDQVVKVDKVTFSCFAPDGNSLVGESVLVKVYKIEDSVADDLSDLDRTSEFNETIKTVGIGSYVFKAADDNLGPFDRYEADVADFNELDSALYLEPGGRYIVAIEYNNQSTDLIHEMGQRLTYYPSLGSDQISSVIFDGNWFTNAPFGNNFTAIVGMKVSIDVKTSNELELSEAQVKIFPNPASDYINVSVALDNPQNVTTYLTDVRGQILDVRTNKNFFKGNIRFDVTKYPSGTYFVRLNSQEGVKVQKIIIGH